MISPLLYPLNWSFVLWGLAAALWWRGRAVAARGCAVAGVAVLGLMSSPLVGDALIGSLEDDYAVRKAADLPAADAIVVLGGMSAPPLPPRVDTEVTDAFDRLLFGVRIWKEGKAPVMVLSGGVIEALVGSDKTEAQRLRQLAGELGVPDVALVLEEKSRDTYENGVYVAALARQEGWRQVLLVTSAFHMRRAMGVFAAQGIVAAAAPADVRATARPLTPRRFMPQVGALERATLALHEYIGLLVYALRGRI